MKTEKLKPVENPPMDIVLVIDSSGSMGDSMHGKAAEKECYNYFPSAKAFLENHNPNPTARCTFYNDQGWYERGKGYFCVNCRIDMVRKAVYNLAEKLLANGENNRLGIVTFQNGAWQRVQPEIIYPFHYRYGYNFNGIIAPHSSYLDIPATKKMVSSFNGNPLPVRQTASRHPLLWGRDGSYYFPWHWLYPYNPSDPYYDQFRKIGRAHV